MHAILQARLLRPDPRRLPHLGSGPGADKATLTPRARDIRGISVSGLPSWGPARLGQLERSIIDLAKKKDGYVRPSDVARALGVDRRRALDALRRLEARGLVRRVARGRYVLAAKDSGQGKARTAANETTSAPDPWLGPLECCILSYALKKGSVPFTPSDVAGALKVDVRSAWQSLRKLSRRGYVRRVAWGWYKLAADPDWLAKLPVRPVAALSLGSAKESPKAAHGTRGPRAHARHTVWPALPPTVLPPGPLNLTFSDMVYDNVRGYTHEGRYVEGDRGRVLRREDLVFFDRVSYLEPGYIIDGLRLPDHTVFVVYANYSAYGPGRAKAELRPPSGYVKEYGAAAAARFFHEVGAVVAYALADLTLTEGPPDVARWLRRQLRALLDRAEAREAASAAWAPALAPGAAGVLNDTWAPAPGGSGDLGVLGPAPP